MVKAKASVPHGIPDVVGDGGDVETGLVQQEQIEIASRREFAATVTANRNKCHARRGQTRIDGDRPKPLIGQGSELSATRRAGAPGGRTQEIRTSDKQRLSAGRGKLRRAVRDHRVPFISP